MEDKIAELLLNIKAVTLSPKKPYRYSSGILSPIYCDNRLLMSYPEKRMIVVDAFLEKIKNLNFDVVGGIATAGIPHAAWIAERLNKPMVYIRGKSKGHGKQNRIEGLVSEGQKVLIIEDLISTGGSSVSAVEPLREKGAVVTDCLAIFTYEMGKAAVNFKEAKVTLHTLTAFSTLIQVAASNGYITDEERKNVLLWNKDPTGWGNQMGFE